MLLGFGSPIAILSGFIFGQWAGTILTAVSFTIGSSLLYKIAQYYFSNFIVNNFSNRIEKYKFFFKQDELLYFFIFRLTGGAGIPFAIQNVLPVIFDMKIKNYIISTLFGLLPTIFIFNSLGSGIQILIGENDKIDYLSLISRAEIYLPILGFLIIIILSFFGRRYIFKEKK